MRLDINVCAGKSCEIFAYDNTQYLDNTLKNCIFVEFVCYYPYSSDVNNLLALDASKKITTFIDNASMDRNYTYMTKSDGWYKYYKYGIYTYDHPSIFYDGVYHITNKVFYYDGKIYFGIEDTVEPMFTTDNTEIISNWYHLRDYTTLGMNSWYDQNIFLICKLNACLIALEKEAIFNGIKNCNFGKCEKDADLKLRREFVFMSVFVLEYLMSIENYEEAQRILESLMSCGALCDDNLLQSNKNCCG